VYQPTNALNKIQQNTDYTVQLIMNINCYMFLHCSATLWESIKTQECRSKTLAFLD